MLYDLDPGYMLPRRALQRLTVAELSGDFAPWNFDGFGGRAHKSTAGRKSFTELGLAMYVDAAGFYRIGFTNAKHQHAHDRWLFRTNLPPARLYGTRRRDIKWIALHPAHSRHDTAGVDFDGELVDELGYVGSTVRRVMVHDVPASAGLRQLRLLGDYNFEQLLASGTKGTYLKANLDFTQAHDLLYHWDEWLLRNPGMADMPRELVLRMHGLGPVLDAEIELNGYAR